MSGYGHAPEVDKGGVRLERRGKFCRTGVGGIGEAERRGRGGGKQVGEREAGKWLAFDDEESE